jgi:hypothetical protein
MFPLLEHHPSSVSLLSMLQCTKTRPDTVRPEENHLSNLGAGSKALPPHLINAVRHKTPPLRPATPTQHTAHTSDCSGDPQVLSGRAAAAEPTSAVTRLRSSQLPTRAEHERTSLPRTRPEATSHALLSVAPPPRRLSTKMCAGRLLVTLPLSSLASFLPAHPPQKRAKIASAHSAARRPGRAPVRLHGAAPLPPQSRAGTARGPGAKRYRAPLQRGRATPQIGSAAAPHTQRAAPAPSASAWRLTRVGGGWTGRAHCAECSLSLCFSLPQAPGRARTWRPLLPRGRAKPH